MKYIFTILVCLLTLSINATLLPFFKVKPQLIPIENTKEKDSLVFTIYPNPLKNQRLFIESKGIGQKHIEIFNVLGEKKFESFTFDNSVFLDKLNTGIYIFRLEQDGESGLKRLVIP